MACMKTDYNSVQKAALTTAEESAMIPSIAEHTYNFNGNSTLFTLRLKQEHGT